MIVIRTKHLEKEIQLVCWGAETEGNFITYDYF